MKRLFTFLILITTFNTFAQIKISGFKDDVFPTFYQQRSSLFRKLPQTEGDVIFLGNSITNGSEWDELFGDVHLKNRGISGDVTAGVLNRLDEVISRKPAKIFLLIGINNLAAGHTPDCVAKSIFTMADRMAEQTPGTRLYVQSILPVNDAFNKFPNHVNKGGQVIQTNVLLQAGAKQHRYTFIDLYPSFCNSDHKLDTLYTNDGLHQKGPGYMLWKHLIYPYVYDLQSRPSLLPQPRSVNWSNENFLLYQCRYIVVKSVSLTNEAVTLQKILAERGWKVAITYKPVDPTLQVITLEQKAVNAVGAKDEVYRLNVTTNEVSIQANTPHGCFNALQTLNQLMRDNVIIPGVEITDYPAFAWRGYMVDVGRNFQSVELLKQQIELMARYKLNIFHFHFTEDIAWRLQIKQYPQLTEPQNMQRNPGAYYSVEEMQDLIKFCRERYITLVPEIDMPGHSAAFKRAFKVDMQSDSGMQIMKNIVKEFCATYSVPYLHIVGDEVKINNKNFLPAMLQYIHSLGKQTIGWSPGGNLDKATIRQLWMSAGASDPKLKYIDSRNLYINHMDPLESVVSIFNRQIGDRDNGGGNVLGATLCVWPDRNVIKQEDLITMNPVYPAMLTFAERSWAGGGTRGWNTIIQTNNNAFAEFEDRLIDQQKQYFRELPFQYVRQSGIKWKLFGPYANKGRLDEQFRPETNGFDPDKDAHQSVTGGTIILRHFWYPVVSAALTKPKDSTTYYAFAKVWSNRDTTASMWIGFYNISRSVPTSTPALGTWDDRHSKLWINGQLVAPYHWARAGQFGNIEKPLVDEGYVYRKPTEVVLHQGWNTVLVKLPVGNFRAGVSQNPVKWMFTAVFVKPLGRGYVVDDGLRFAGN